MKIRRLLSLLLALALILPGATAIPARAAGAGIGVDPNPSRKDLTLEESRQLYDDHTHVAYADTHQWPSAGTVCMEVAGVFKLSDLNGNTIPANLIVDVYQRYDGDKLRFLVRYDTTDGKAVTVSDAEADAENGSKVAGFSDVHFDDYYAEAVKWAVEQGITNGTSSTTFSPDATVTRAEAVTFLWRAAGAPEPVANHSSFSDVADTNAYYYKAVSWAVGQGITNGMGGGQFGPKSTLTYDQILAFLCRAAGGDTGSDWTNGALRWAAEEGLTDGLTFSAKASCPRSDVVYCLWKQLAEEEGAEGGSSQDVPAGLSDVEGAKAAIINGLMQLETSIDVSPYHIESSALVALAEDIVNVDGYDNYYGIIRYWCTQPAGETAWTLQVTHKTNDLEQMEQQRQENAAIKNAVDKILAQAVEPGMSDYETAKALHDYLVLNCSYDMRLYTGNLPADSYRAYGALVNKTAVCAGYAQAYQMLLEAVDIPCEYVTGSANGGSHAWNIVQIDGEWYHVDTTWDDPIPDREGYVRYDYFMKSDSYMSRDHFNWTADHTCTSSQYDQADLPDSFEQKEEEQQA